MGATEQSEIDAAILQAQSEQKLLIVRFTAPWCRLCEGAAKEVEVCQRDFAALVVVVDLAEAGELGAENGVRKLPRVFVYSGGSRVADVEGAREGAVRDACKEHAFVGGVAGDVDF